MSQHRLAGMVPVQVLLPGTRVSMFREEYGPTASLCELVPTNTDMAVALRGYYDGTGCQEAAHRGELIGLAGYSAAPLVWEAFEAEWWRVCQDDSERPRCAYFHAKEAKHLKGEFSPENGWTAKAVESLIRDLFNKCFSPFGRHDVDKEATLIGAACTVDLHAYERVCNRYPHFVSKKPEALCVDHVVGLALNHLVPSPLERMALSEMAKRRQSIALFFDRNESFKHHISRVWERYPWSKRPMALKLVHSIGEVDKESSAALQAADFLAWHTNRDVASDGGDMSARLMAFFAARTFTLHYDEAELERTAEAWTESGGYRSTAK